MILYSPRGFLPNRRMLPIAALVAFAAPQARAQDAALRIGIAWLDSATGCVAISNAALAAGTPLTFVRVPVSGMGELAVAVTGETFAAAALTAPGCASIHGGSPNDHLYTIRLAQGSGRGAYFALLTPRQSVTLRGPSATVRFPPDSSPVSLRTCTSGEGLHFTAWRGEPLKGPRIFHGYASLSYDVELSCDDAEMLPSGRVPSPGSAVGWSDDGDLIAFIRPTPGRMVLTALGPEEATELWIAKADGSQARRLVVGGTATGGGAPMAALSDPVFSPDATRLYFLSRAGVTSSAIHVVDIATRQERFVALGNTVEVISRGAYAGCLLVEQHRYRSEGGSYDWYWVLGTNGHELTLAASDASDAEERLSDWRRGDIPRTSPPIPSAPPAGACRSGPQ